MKNKNYNTFVFSSPMHKFEVSLIMAITMMLITSALPSPLLANEKVNIFRGKIFKKENHLFFEKLSQGYQEDLLQCQESSSEIYSLKLPSYHQKYFDDVLATSEYSFFQIKGIIRPSSPPQSQEPILEGFELPTQVSDCGSYLGKLTLKNGFYFFNDQPLCLGRIKEVTGYHFNPKSMEHFSGTQVLIEGHQERRGENQECLVANAIQEADLFTLNSALQKNKPSSLDLDPLRFIKKELPLNNISQSKKPFRAQLVKEDKKNPVKQGDGVLILTFSGRQGESPGSSGGHFAAGGGFVRQDGRIQGELYNYYFKSEKEVIAGNSDLTHYFNHLIQGQHNYRPTYTMLIYGVDLAFLKRVRDRFEEWTHYVRIHPERDITLGNNCSTVSNDILKEFHFYGHHQRILPRIFDIQNVAFPLSYFSDGRETKADSLGEMARMVGYILHKDREYYIPRKTFESFAQILIEKQSFRKKHKIKRVDFLFTPQTPSDRPIGGMSYDEMLLEARGIISFSLERDKRLENESKAQMILKNESGHTAEEILWAKEVISKAVSKEEDVRQVQEILNKID